MRSSRAARSFRALIHSKNVQWDISTRRTYGVVSGTTTYPSLIDSITAASTPRSVFQEAIEAKAPRTNWTLEEIKHIYETPLMELAFAAVSYHPTHSAELINIPSRSANLYPHLSRALFIDASITPQASKCVHS